MEIVNRVRSIQWPRKTRPDQWDEEVLFIDGDSYFSDLISGIDSAKTTIDLETYIFQRGILAERVAAALRRATARGVRIRLLIDGVGSPQFWNNYGKELEVSGVHIRLFRIWPWQMPWIRKGWARWLNVNRGNHRKTCIIDDATAWIGSMNISDHHLRESHGEQAWLDVGVRVRGPEIARLKSAFDSAFSADNIQNPFQPSNALLFLNSNSLLRLTNKHHMVRRLKKAKNRVWIETPYFVPIPAVYRRLRRLAKAGIDVRVIVPRTNDVWLVKWISQAFIAALIKVGVRFFEYQPQFMHQKVMFIDDWITIGTSNLNHRSFFHDLEVDVVIRSDANRRLLERKFLQEQEQSREITNAYFERISYKKRWLGRFLLLLRYWS